MRKATCDWYKYGWLSAFQSPPSVRKATWGQYKQEVFLHISIPAFREEGDAESTPKALMTRKFQSPPSVRKATNDPKNTHQISRISIPAFREEGDGSFDGLPIGHFFISIPAFREEGDVIAQVLQLHGEISIPAFREEGDLQCRCKMPPTPGFQSPPSVRKATCSSFRSVDLFANFNPRLP